MTTARKLLLIFNETIDLPPPGTNFRELDLTEELRLTDSFESRITDN